jgi:hypothetical protein
MEVYFDLRMGAGAGNSKKSRWYFSDSSAKPKKEMMLFIDKLIL